MNYSPSTLAGNAFRPATKKPLLPQKATFHIPAGLNWVIRQRLTSVIVSALMSGTDSTPPVDDLCRLDTFLSQQRASQPLTLYGFELSTLYSFLLAQYRLYSVWSPSLVSDRASRTLLADLRGILPQLRAICRGVDLYADRPIHKR